MFIFICCYQEHSFVAVALFFNSGLSTTIKQVFFLLYFLGAISSGWGRFDHHRFCARYVSSVTEASYRVWSKQFSRVFASYVAMYVQ